VAHGFGTQRTTATITFTGRLDLAAFAAFVHQRAQLLDLAATLAESHPGRVAVTVSGHPDMIDAFELACSLGPRNCLVRDIARREP
jgi:acylphosphatase